MASATTRYASSNGAGNPPCTEADEPCELFDALGSAEDTDDVRLASGDYELGNDGVVIQDTIDVLGAGADSSRIVSTAEVAVRIGSSATGATVNDLGVAQSGGGTAGLSLSKGTANRVLVSSDAQTACRLDDGVLMRDAVCHSTAAMSANAVELAATASSMTANLMNVTAYASGATDAVGIRASAGAGHKAMVLVRNTIAFGTTDIVASTDSSPGVRTMVNIAFSNFDVPLEVDPNADITESQSVGNQSDPPLLANPEADGFHQRSDSPTIDAGTAAGGLGSRDLDGQQRNQGEAPDIGADEFPFGPPPETTLTKKPKRKTRKRIARFRFESSEPNSTFECKLDGKPYLPCTSPFRKRVKRGRHRFRVRAIDAAGNADPTPAKRKWKVKPRGRR